MASSQQSKPKNKTDLKLIILGAANVGKTTLLQRYLTGDFADTISSIGASLALKKWDDWNVALWDTAGEEKYASLSAFYCRGASVAVLAFDLTSTTSYAKLRDIFIPLLQDSVDNCLTVVVGTKLDLIETETEHREVRRSEGVELAVQQHQFQLQRALKHNPETFLKGIDGSKLYYETSSKTGKGVDDMFEEIKSILLADLEKAGTGSASAKKSAKAAAKGGGIVQLGDQTDSAAPRNKSCCAGN